MQIGEYQTHPTADVFPLLEGAAFEALCDDIREHGLLHPIVRYVLDDGTALVLDGRNRLRACLRVGVAPRWVDYDGNDPHGYVISENLHRRHLDESQRALSGARLARLKHGGAARRGNKGGQAADLPPMTQAEAGRRFNVSPRLIRAAGKLLEKVQAGRAVPELLELVDQGAITVSAATPLAKRQLPEQQIVVAELRTGKRLPVVMRERASLRAQTELAAARSAARDAGLFDVVVVDPPWTKGGKATVDELRKLELPAAPAAHVWLWTPATALAEGLTLLERWGFAFVCPFVWHKEDGLQPPGMPQYNCEVALYGRRGAAAFTGPGVGEAQTCFRAKAGRRGAKPAAFYALVRELTEGARRLDVYAETQPEGFDDRGHAPSRRGKPTKGNPKGNPKGNGSGARRRRAA